MPKETPCISFLRVQTRSKSIQAPKTLDLKTLNTKCSRIFTISMRFSSKNRIKTWQTWLRNNLIPLTKTIWPNLPKLTGSVTFRTYSKKHFRPLDTWSGTKQMCWSIAWRERQEHLWWPRWSKFSVIHSTGRSKVSKSYCTRNGTSISIISRHLDWFSWTWRPQQSWRSKSKNPA